MDVLERHGAQKAKGRHSVTKQATSPKKRSRNWRLTIHNRTVFVLWGFSLVAALITVKNERMRETLYNITYLLAALIVFSFFWALINIRWVELERKTRARRSQVGKPAEEKFTLRNKSWFPKLWLDVRDNSSLPGHRASRVLNSIGPGRWRDWSVRTTCRERGVFYLGPLTISTGDPFSLFRITRNIDQTSPIVVYPATVELNAFTPPIGRLPGGDAVRRRTHYVTTNVSGVRDYTPGDSFGRIHWPSTARKDRLIVKEFELDPTADIWIFLDMQRGVQAGLEIQEPIVELPALFRPRKRKLLLKPSTEEYAVTAAASLAQHFIRQNRAVGLVAYGQRREVLPADRGERQLTKILESLAVLQAEGGIPISQVLASESDRLTRGTTLVIITPAPDEHWVLVSRDLSRRGLRSIAVLLEPLSFGRTISAERPLALLQASNTPTYLVHCDESLAASLSIAV
ncbi:MAG: hypothetical protein B6I34_02285 [Anaerolineaceae bacterium 4572_32.1]|nr:MAG: hypothetical protein B6I34_02285 [Anaerolineaceae bacterium 4572_32.1]